MRNCVIGILSAAIAAWGPQVAAQVAWDESCATDNWHTCCDRGGGVFENNWDVGPGPSCPLPLPGENDHVDLQAFTVRLDQGPVAIRSLSNGSLTLLQQLTVGESVNLTNLNFLGGFTLSAGDDLVIAQAFDWRNGTLHGIDGARAAANGSTTIAGNVVKRLDGRTLVCNGPVTWRDFGEIELNNAAVFDNRASFTAINDAFLRGNGGRFVNNETFTKRSSNGTTRVFDPIAFENTSLGRIDVESGTLLLEGGGANRGQISVAQNCTLHFNTAQSRSFGFMTQTVIGGTGRVEVTGSGIAAADNVTVTIPNLRLNGLLSGPGKYRIGDLEWLGNSMSGGETLVSGVVTLSGAPDKILSNGHQFTNDGEATWMTGGDLSIRDTAHFINTGTFTVQNNLIARVANAESRFTNEAGGTMVTEGIQRLFLGPGTFENRGTLRVGPEGIRCQVEAGTFVQDGRVEVQAGDLLILGSGGGSNGGVFDVVGGSRIDFAAGTFRCEGCQFQGEGTVRLTGARTLDIVGTVQAANLEIQSAGANITGAGTLQVLTKLDWLAGSMTGTGVTVCRNTVNLGGPDEKVISQRSFLHEGEATWTDGDITLNSAGVLHVAAGATLEVQTPADFEHTGGDAGIINNDGVIRRSGVAGTLTFPAGVDFNNRGSLVVNDGNVETFGGGVASGLFAIAESSAVIVRSASYELAGGAQVQGLGPLRFAGGLLTVTGDVEAQIFEIAAGELAGPGAMNVTQTFRWTGSSGIIEGLTLTSKAQGTIAPGTRYGLGPGATLVNEGTLTLTQAESGTTFFGADFDPGAFTNRGSFEISVPGQDVGFDPGAVFSNQGTVTLQAQMMEVRGGGQSSGVFQLENTGLVIRTTPYQFSAGTTFTGGTLILDGPVSINGDIQAEQVLVASLARVDGPGTLTVSQQLDVVGGPRWIGPGRLVNRGSAVISGVTFEGGGFDNEGQTQVNGADDVLLNDSMIFNNRGAVTLGSTQGLGFEIEGTADSVINNFGPFTNLLGAGQTVTVDVPFNNVSGAVINDGSATLRLAGPFRQFAGGSLIVRRGRIVFDEPPQIANGSRIEGRERITVNGGPLNNEGTISPGESPGTLTLEGDYIQEPDGTLELELGGPTPDSEHDVFVVTGNATLGGELRLVPIDGFEPQVGDTFTVMTFASSTGQFDSVIPPCGLELVVQYYANDVTLEVTGLGVFPPADLDADCDVDLDDHALFAACMAGPGVTDPPDGCDLLHFDRADLDGDGDADLADWGELAVAFTGP